MLLGPATNVATVAVLGRAYGARAVMLGIAVIGATSCVFGVLVNAIGVPVTLPVALETAHEHGAIAWVCALVLGAALVWQLWREGIGPWLDVLDAAGHAHLHGHDHEGGHWDAPDHDHHDHDHDHHGHDHA
jgi:hypothetical protein